MKKLIAQPLTADAFHPYGDVLDASGAPDKIINQGRCGRYHDRARLDFGTEGRAGISVFKAELRAVPVLIDLMERHPDGSQTFLPMDSAPFLVVVALDDDGKPGNPQAFLAAPGQGVNYLRNTWHAVLTPVSGSGLFAVIDRIGPGKNLQEHVFSLPYQVFTR